MTPGITSLASPNFRPHFSLAVSATPSLFLDITHYSRRHAHPLNMAKKAAAAPQALEALPPTAAPKIEVSCRRPPLPPTACLAPSALQFFSN